jgi:hypothetical protein
MRVRPLLPILLLALWCGGWGFAEESLVGIVADPAAVQLTTPQAAYSLLIHGKTADGRLVDMTRRARFRSATPSILDVSAAGVVRGIADGHGSIEATVDGRTVRIDVQVRNARSPRRFNFENDVVPILSKFTCNSSGCHGKAEGQNGFKLSVFGFDPPADYDALTKEARGRRVFLASPERSLLLQKSSGGAPHGGGIRIRLGSPEYSTLLAWITVGVPRGDDKDTKVVSLKLTPRERIMTMRAAQQLRAVACYSDGHEEDVTPLAKFQSNNDALAAVNESGLVTVGDVPGQVAVMASYMGAVDVFRAIVPRSERIENYPQLAEHNFIDRLVHAQLRKLNIAPAEVCDDATFLRRAYLDVIGTLPTVAEARAFLADVRADKRQRLVDELLQRPEYADYWALIWSDLLRVDRQTLGHKGAYAYYRWIRESFARNKPMDRFARELLTASGPLDEAPEGNFFQVTKRPGDMASTFSQVFLGVRIACAECHHHPFDRWSQTDYYGMVGFFAQVHSKASPLGSVMLASGTNPQTSNPRTGQVVHPHPLGTAAPAELPKPLADGADRRAVLADWLTHPQNPWFARNITNRVWARFLGRGVVEPVDDFRDTNPPTNPPLLDALAQHLVEAKFDLRQLIRTITASRTYQLSSAPNATNQRDEQNYSRALLKRIDAEVLLDAVCQATGVPEKFEGVPAGYRAIQLWDNRAPHYFLKLFGRPVRETACECERSSEASIAQVLHLMNSPQIQAKLAHEGGQVARLAATASDDGRLVDELYLTICSRYPNAQERVVAVEHLRSAQTRRGGAEDVAWSLLNSLEFVFNH